MKKRKEEREREREERGEKREERGEKEEEEEEEGKGADLTPPHFFSLASPHRPLASDGSWKRDAESIYEHQKPIKTYEFCL